jgi:hypothetical protein
MFRPEQLLLAKEHAHIDANEMQIALMRRWGATEGHHFEDDNALALAWISEGLALKFREHIDAHPEELQTLDVEDEENLESILKEIEGETMH